MNKESLSLREAQRHIMASQWLTGPKRRSLEIIEHLGYVQIDTISVVERAHHHVFWARDPKYKPSDLDDLVRTRKVFEHWSHAASYLPMKDYRFSVWKKQDFAKKSSSWFPRDPKLMKQVLRRIKAEGPLRSSDFQHTRKKKNSGWWDWKPAKKALERLFLEGDLEISRREGFQKVYDLPERVIPSSVDTTMPNKRESIRFLIQRTLKHHGLATAKEVGYLEKKAVIDAIQREFKEMMLSGELTEVAIESIDEPYYALSDRLKSPQFSGSKVLILSPFDNLVIQRKKLKRFFKMDYQIECYVPESKRKYGYFSLPVFKGATPVARIDCKADRKAKKLIVQSVSFEHAVDPTSLQENLEVRLRAFAKFNQCSTIEHH